MSFPDTTGCWFNACPRTFFCIEQSLSRVTDLPLFAIPAGQLPSDESITRKPQKEERYDEREDCQREPEDKEQYAGENGDHKLPENQGQYLST